MIMAHGHCHYTFVQIVEYKTLKVKHKVNDGLWVIIMCQCSSSCKISASSVRNVDNGGGYTWRGQSVWKFSYLPLDVALNLK